MNETFAQVLTIASAEAFFSFVCPQVLLTQPRIIEFTALKVVTMFGTALGAWIDLTYQHRSQLQRPP